MADSKAGMIIVIELAYENDNAARQTAIFPFQKEGDNAVRGCLFIFPIAESQNNHTETLLTLLNLLALSYYWLALTS